MQTTLSSLWTGAEHRRFPDLAFLDFAVAEHDVGARRALVQTSRQAHSDPDRQSLAERSGGGFERGNEAHVGVALVDRAELPQILQLVHGRIAGLRHHGIENGAAVSLGKNEAVAIRPVGFAGSCFMHVEVKRYQDLDRRKRSARVAGLGRRNHFDDLPPGCASNRLQLFDVLRLLHKRRGNPQFNTRVHSAAVLAG